MSYPIQPLLDSFAAHADPENAAAMSAYMRDLFPFYGIKKPERAALFKAYLGQYGLPADEAALHEAVRALWDRPERECHYSACDLLGKQLKKLSPASLGLIEQLIVSKSWWDTVDALTSYAGTLFQRHPASRDQFLNRWRAADDFWLRRAAILHQRHYRTATDADLLFAIIRENLGSREFFINKAIGWALREYSKENGAAVREFIANHDLAPLSAREGAKWLQKHS